MEKSETKKKAQKIAVLLKKLYQKEDEYFEKKKTN